MDKKKKRNGNQEGSSFSVFYGKDKHALEKDNDKGKTIDAWDASHLDKEEILILAAAQKSPWEPCEDVGQDVFQWDPDQRRKHKSWFRKRPVYPGKDKAEDAPEKSKKENKDEINQKAEGEGEVAVVSRDRRNPVDQERIVRESGQKSDKECLWRLVFKNDEEERNKGYPDKKGKAPFWEGQGGEEAAEYGQDDISGSYPQIQTGLSQI